MFLRLALRVALRPFRLRRDFRPLPKTYWIGVPFFSRFGRPTWKPGSLTTFGVFPVGVLGRLLFTEGAGEDGREAERLPGKIRLGKLQCLFKLLISILESFFLLTTSEEKKELERL